MNKDGKYVSLLCCFRPFFSAQLFLETCNKMLKILINC